MVSTPKNPMVLLIIIPTKWLFHREYTLHFQTYPNNALGKNKHIPRGRTLGVSKKILAPSWSTGLRTEAVFHPWKRSQSWSHVGLAGILCALTIWKGLSQNLCEEGGQRDTNGEGDENLEEMVGISGEQIVGRHRSQRGASIRFNSCNLKPLKRQRQEGTLWHLKLSRSSQWWNGVIHGEERRLFEM